MAEQILLIFTDPRHVAVRPQQRRGHVQFLADVDDKLFAFAFCRPLWTDKLLPKR